MNNFLRGILLGVGIGLLIAPMKGEEMRRRISERANEMRGYLPENEQLSLYSHQVSDRMTQTAGAMKDYAQQAASTVKTSASNLNDIAHNAASTVKSTGQSVAEKTKETVKKVPHPTPPYSS